jgi:RNA polymerase sigma-70 factor (ECF subfamily)
LRHELQWFGLDFPTLSEDHFNPNPNQTRSSSRALQPIGSLEDDLVLLERVKARDQQAMAKVFDRYSGMAYSVALRVLKDPAQADDVIQEVFFHFWEKPSAFSSERGSLAPWLAVVT